MAPTTLALDLNARYVKAISLINDGLSVLPDESQEGFSKDIKMSTYTLIELWLSLTLLKAREAMILLTIIRG